MRTLIIILASASSLLAQMGGAPPMKYQANFDDIKAVLGLTDDQIAQLKKIQQDKVTATQAFYSKMSDKQKELSQLLETNSTDATKIGQLMLELQQLRKQPPPGGTDVHDKAVAVLTPEQREKLGKIEEAQKLRSTVDQGLQLGLLNPPITPAMAGKTGPAPGNMHPMTPSKPPAKQ
jgi:Spy/CpxP family protein refolding chaperone